MAVSLIFEEEGCDLHPKLELFATLNNKVFIKLSYKNDDLSEVRAIRLDKPTAIKLAKELRKQISLLEG
jgi:hypothetical protein